MARLSVILPEKERNAMASLFLGNKYTLDVLCYHTGRAAIGVNRSHWEVAATAGLSVTEAAAAAGISVILRDLYKVLLYNGAEYRGVRLQKFAPATPWLPIEHRDVVSGTAGVQGLPPQIAGSIKKLTAFAGRAWRGRVYVPFPAEDDNDAAAEPSNGYMVRLDALAAFYGNSIALGAGGNTATLKPVLYHAETGGVTDIMTAVSVRRWIEQRRRGDYGGPDVKPLP